MRHLTLQELQQFSLDILKDVAGFCEKNNIRYSLGYGTMLGEELADVIIDLEIGHGVGA